MSALEPACVRASFGDAPVSCSRAPNMCSTFSGGFKLNLRYIYISRDDTSKNSLDLERAPGARSIDDEFLLVSYLVIEI